MDSVKQCERCAATEERAAILHDKLERIREILVGTGDGRKRRAAPEYLSPHGRLIAATASAKNMKLADVSRSIGYGSDHVAKVCRGDITLSRRLALLIGAALGIDLVPYLPQQELPAAEPDAAGPPSPEALRQMDRDMRSSTVMP